MNRSGRARGRGWILACLGLGITGPLAVAVPVAAQEADADDPIAEAFFDPELVMQNRQEIGLTEAQWDEISRELRELQRSAVDFEWDMAEAGLDLVEIASQEHVDEAAALEAAQRIFEVESRIKTIQMQMLIRIKNILTPQQQSALRTIRGGMGL